MKKQLVFVWNYLNWGGSQVYFFGVMKLALEYGWDLLVILPRASSPEVVRYLDELKIKYRFVDHALDTAPATTLARKLKRQLNRLKVEYLTFRELQKIDRRNTIFQIEIAPWQSVAFLTAMSLSGANVYIATHNFLPDDSPIWRRIIWKTRLQFVSRLPGINFFCSNHDTKNRMLGWVSEKFRQKVVVAHTSVDLAQMTEAGEAPFDVRTARRKYGIDENDFVVLCVGQFIDRKGRWIFLEAAEKVLDTRSDVSFVWITPKLPDPSERERIAGFNLREKFHIILSETLGANRLDVLRFFRIADVFALPSYVEGLPGALLEAMSLGIPSISTRVNAVPEAVLEDETGVLIPPGDASALADAIIAFKNDEEFRTEIARGGRRYVYDNFDERASAQIVIDQYTEALKRGR